MPRLANPEALIAQGVRFWERYERLPSCRELTGNNGLPSENTIKFHFGWVSRYVELIVEALTARQLPNVPSAPRDRRGIRSDDDYSVPHDDHLGCNMGVTLDGPCACEACRAYQSPERACTCGAGRKWCPACRAHAERYGWSIALVE